MRVGEIVEQNSWVLKAMGVALAGALAGSAVVTTVATRALLDVVPAEDDGSSSAEKASPAETVRASTVSDDARRRAAKEQVAAEILGYNPFCHGCTPPEPEQPSSAPAVAIADAPMSTLAVKVVATMESTEPTASLATIYDTQRGTTALYGIGDRLTTVATVEAIGGGVVSVRTPEGLTVLRVGQSPEPEPEPRTRRTPKRRTNSKANAIARSSKSTLPGAADAITCDNSNTCVVERKFVDDLMANPAALATQAAVRPTGQGFQLTRVRAGSLPALLGLKRGDVLTEVNGQSLDSVDKVLTMATKLRRASTLEVTLVRGGKQVRKEIQIS